VRVGCDPTCSDATGPLGRCSVWLSVWLHCECLVVMKQKQMQPSVRSFFGASGAARSDAAATQSQQALAANAKRAKDTCAQEAQVRCYVVSVLCSV
jgi:hypothetical protein